MTFKDELRKRVPELERSLLEMPDCPERQAVLTLLDRIKRELSS